MTARFDVVDLKPDAGAAAHGRPELFNLGA
jgi:hypothetical protein